MSDLDAILVPGGGLRENGTVPPWVENRLERALELAAGKTPILTLSAGTTHKPGPRDAEGRTIFESVAAARWLLHRGYPAELIFTETTSYDTIGNAYFARFMHADPAGWRRVAVITSAFHMPRTEAIFRWIFSVTPCEPHYELSFVCTPDVGMATEALAARRAKEQVGQRALVELAGRLPCLSAVHRWLFTEHAAYAVSGQEAGLRPLADERVLQSY